MRVIRPLADRVVTIDKTKYFRSAYTHAGSYYDERYQAKKVSEANGEDITTQEACDRFSDGKYKDKFIPIFKYPSDYDYLEGNINTSSVPAEFEPFLDHNNENSCCCNHSVPSGVYVLKNTVTGHFIDMGTTCIKKFDTELATYMIQVEKIEKGTPRTKLPFRLARDNNTNPFLDLVQTNDMATRGSIDPRFDGFCVVTDIETDKPKIAVYKKTKKGNYIIKNIYKSKKLEDRFIKLSESDSSLFKTDGKEVIVEPHVFYDIAKLHEMDSLGYECINSNLLEAYVGSFYEATYTEAEILVKRFINNEYR